MGKAARKRKNNRKRYLINLASLNTEQFDYQWERRLDSWLREIQLTARELGRNTIGTDKLVFSILDEAMDILKACGPATYARYANKTYESLSDACCRNVSNIMNCKLYRLSNLANLPMHGNKTTRLEGKVRRMMGASA